MILFLILHSYAHHYVVYFCISFLFFLFFLAMLRAFGILVP